MKPDSLAILLRPKKGGADEGDSGDEEEPKEEGTSDEDYKSLAEEAFPDEDWTPERVSALKEFVMSCMEK